VTATPSPEEWLASFDATIADVQARTTAFQRDLEQERAAAANVAAAFAPLGADSEAMHMFTAHLP
jgi:hypothetical protein